MSQRVRALFLVFENSPCQRFVGDAIRDAYANGWATQLYYLDKMVTPSFIKCLEHHGATPYCAPGDAQRPRKSICSWLLVRVLQDTIALAEREQAQLFVFCGGYGTGTDTESVLYGSPSTLPPQPLPQYSIIDPFLILDEMADCNRECLVILHTYISEAQLQDWRSDRQHQPKSNPNVEILLFNEKSAQRRTEHFGEVHGIEYEMEAPQFQQVEKVTEAL